MQWASTIIQLLTAAEAFLNSGTHFGRRKANLLLPTDKTTCGVVPTYCQESKYRSYDGSCNNLQFGYWGTPNTTYIRLLANSYSDGVSEFPKSVTGADLPNPRTISLRSFVDIRDPDVLWTLIFMQYGQIIAHDLSLNSAVSQTSKGQIVCCSKGQLTEAAKTNKNCAPIEIPETDPYGAPEGRKCMDFVKTLTTHGAEKCIGVTDVAEPLTAVTSFLDVSFMYGSDEEVANAVREFRGGRLASVRRDGRELLPQNPEPELACNVNSKMEPCYVAGDVRVNQNPQLAVLHNIYLLLHNNIARGLAQVNPHWNDYILFQETRRIVIAMHQRILYNEFLPPLIGLQNMIDNKLIYPNAEGHVNDYEPDVNPGMSNEAATAAYRVFHSEIIGQIELITEHRNVSKNKNHIELSDWMNKPSICEHANNFNKLTIGLASQPQSAVNRFLTTSVTNFMFKDGLLGQDLKAIDIWRSRNHGLGTYVQALKKFHQYDARSFDDFKKFIKPQYVNVLRGIYESHEDVDLIVGMSLEKLMPNSLSGATVQAIMTEQFKRSRVGDRFFYENGAGKSSFKIEQLKEIRRISSIAGLLCNNPGIIHMQREAFKLVSDKNPLTTCDKLPRFNPNAWKE